MFIIMSVCWHESPLFSARSLSLSLSVNERNSLQNKPSQIARLLRSTSSLVAGAVATVIL